MICAKTPSPGTGNWLSQRCVCFLPGPQGQRCSVGSRGWKRRVGSDMQLSVRPQRESCGHHGPPQQQEGGRALLFSSQTPAGGSSHACGLARHRTSEVWPVMITTWISQIARYCSAWCKEPTHWKRPWCWEGLKAGEGNDRGWDGWMASLTRWTSLSKLREMVMDRDA